MTRIDLVAVQQRLAPQQPKPATPVGLTPVVEYTASASISLATAPAPKAGPGTASAGHRGHAARHDAHARSPALESDERTRGTRRERARANTLRAQIDELNAELAAAHAEADGRCGGTAADGPAEQAGGSAISRGHAGREAAEAVIGRAERAEAAKDAERARAEALRSTIDELRAGQAEVEIHVRELAVAQTTPTRRSRRCGATPGRGRAEGEGALGAAQGGVAGVARQALAVGPLLAGRRAIEAVPGTEPAPATGPPATSRNDMLPVADPPHRSAAGALAVGVTGLRGDGATAPGGGVVSHFC